MGVAPSGSFGYRSASSVSAVALISAPTRRSSSARPGPCLGMSSSMNLRTRQATGLRSLAKASQPSRSASKGIEPPPAKGSTTSGVSSGWAARTNARPVSKYSALAELSQLAKSAMNRSSVRRSPSSVATSASQPDARLRMASRVARAPSLNNTGQCGSHGSGSNSAMSTARDDASGRRAHHKCRVDGCPCRIDFSRAACRDTSAIGKSTSARRLQDAGIIALPSTHYVVPTISTKLDIFDFVKISHLLTPHAMMIVLTMYTTRKAYPFA